MAEDVREPGTSRIRSVKHSTITFGAKNAEIKISATKLKGRLFTKRVPRVITWTQEGRSIEMLE
jgi:hypothetical protein